MRILAVIIGLVGVLGAGFMGFAGGAAKQKSEQKGDRIPTDAMDPATKKRVQTVDTAIYAMMAAGPIGFVATLMAAGRKGKLAALLFLIAYAAPVAILMSGIPLKMTDDVVKLMVFVPGGLAVAGVLSLFIPPNLAHSRVRQAEARDD